MCVPVGLLFPLALPLSFPLIFFRFRPRPSRTHPLLSFSPKTNPIINRVTNQPNNAAEELDGGDAVSPGLTRAESVNGLALAAALGEEEGGGIRAQAVAAREAQRSLAALTGEERSAVLRAVARALLANVAEVRRS